MKISKNWQCHHRNSGIDSRYFNSWPLSGRNLTNRSPVRMIDVRSASYRNDNNTRPIQQKWGVTDLLSTCPKHLLPHKAQAQLSNVHHTSAYARVHFYCAIHYPWMFIFTRMDHLVKCLRCCITSSIWRNTTKIVASLLITRPSIPDIGKCV